MCFSINNRDSFDSVSQKWIPEISHHAPEAKWVLVGTKSDLRSENDVVTRAEAESVAERLNGSGYVECSSLDTADLPEYSKGPSRPSRSSLGRRVSSAGSGDRPRPSRASAKTKRASLIYSMDGLVEAERPNEREILNQSVRRAQDMVQNDARLRCTAPCPSWRSASLRGL